MESRARLSLILEMLGSEIEDSRSDESWALGEGVVEDESPFIVSGSYLNDDESSETTVSLKCIALKQDAFGVVLDDYQALFNESSLLKD